MEWEENETSLASALAFCLVMMSSFGLFYAMVGFGWLFFLLINSSVILLMVFLRHHSAPAHIKQWAFLPVPALANAWTIIGAFLSSNLSTGWSGLGEAGLSFFWYGFLGIVCAWFIRPEPYVLGFSVAHPIVVALVGAGMLVLTIKATDVFLGDPYVGVSMNGDCRREPADCLIVLGVEIGSPAAQAGLRYHDRIIAVSGQKLSNDTELWSAIQGKSPGQKIPLTIERSGSAPLTVEIVLGSKFRKQSVL